MIILHRHEIEKLFNPSTARLALRRALEALAIGNVSVPPAAHLHFSDAPGECHVKTGYIRGDAVYAVKVSNGFYDNPRRGLPSSDGMVLLFSAETGEPQAVFIDRGFLTDMRTALTGAIATKLLARRDSKRVGIVGCGTQARLQLLALREDWTQLEATVWGRNPDKAAAFQSRLRQDGVNVHIANDLSMMCGQSDILVTATAAHVPLIDSAWIQPGTHITAVGADAEGKQELDVAILQRAHVVAADSAENSLACGEAGNAVRAGFLDERNVVELGTLLPRVSLQRPDDAVTVADLTGVAAQDVAVARSLWEQCVAMERRAVS